MPNIIQRLTRGLYHPDGVMSFKQFCDWIHDRIRFKKGEIDRVDKKVFLRSDFDFVDNGINLSSSVAYANVNLLNEECVFAGGRQEVIEANLGAWYNSAHPTSALYDVGGGSVIHCYGNYIMELDEHMNEVARFEAETNDARTINMQWVIIKLTDDRFIIRPYKFNQASEETFPYYHVVWDRGSGFRAKKWTEKILVYQYPDDPDVKVYAYPGSIPLGLFGVGGTPNTAPWQGGVIVYSWQEAETLEWGASPSLFSTGQSADDYVFQGTTRPANPTYFYTVAYATNRVLYKGELVWFYLDLDTLDVVFGKRVSPTVTQEGVQCKSISRTSGVAHNGWWDNGVEWIQGYDDLLSVPVNKRTQADYDWPNTGYYQDKVHANTTDGTYNYVYRFIAGQFIQYRWGPPTNFQAQPTGATGSVEQMKPSPYNGGFF